VTFIGLSSGNDLILSFGTSLPSVWHKYEVSIDENANRETWSHGQRGLDIETAPNHLLSGLIERVGGAVPQRLDDGAVVAIRVGTCT
jgi:hypothetical protein